MNSDYFQLVGFTWWFCEFTFLIYLTTFMFAVWLGAMKMIIRWIRRDGNPVVGDK